MAETPIPLRPYLPVMIGVCSAATAAGAIAGYASAFFYDTVLPDAGPIGAGVGAAAGLAAGLLWCAAMSLWTRRARGTGLDVARPLKLRGLLAGLGVGVLATAALHLAMQFLSESWELSFLWGGLAFGLPAGWLVGDVASWRWARRAYLQRLPDEPGAVAPQAAAAEATHA